MPDKELTLKIGLTWQCYLDACGRYLEEKSNNVNLRFRRTAPEVTFPKAPTITYGDKLSTSILAGGSTSRGYFEWLNGDTILPVSNSGDTVIFNPNDLKDYYYSDHLKGWNAGTSTVRRIVNITINKAIPTEEHLQFTPTSVDYNGTSQEITSVSTVDPLTGLGTITAIYYTGKDGTTYTKSTTAPTNVGTYTITVDVAEGDNFEAANGIVLDGTYTINKITPTATHLKFEPTNIDYDGTAHGVTVSEANPFTGLGKITRTCYTGTNGTTYGPSTDAPTEAGKYSITVDVDGTGANFKEADNVTLTGDFTINKATLTADHLEYDLTSATYDGLPHGIETPTLNSKYYSGMGDVTDVKYMSNDGGVAYPLSTTPPVNAGHYIVKISVKEGDNFKPTNDLELTGGTFNIDKATPTLEALVLDPDTIVCYMGYPLGITAPVLKEPYTGLGSITIKYRGSTTLPDMPGTYIITIDIAEGDNYVAIKNLLIGYLYILPPPAPKIMREVTLNVSPYFAVNWPGNFYVESTHNLEIILTPLATLPDGYVPKVTTNRISLPDNKGGVTVTRNSNGAYTVRIANIQQNMTVTIDAVSSVANENIAGARIWSYGQWLYIAAVTGDSQAYIYNMTGVLVKILPYISGETVSTTLPAGAYIVVAEGRQYKILVTD
jgi:hypothetical protein